MTYLEKAKLYLIKCGFDNTVALELPNLFIADYLSKEQEVLSILFDVFIDYIYKANNQKQLANFGNVTCINFQDMTDNYVGMYDSFKQEIIEQFKKYIMRQPLFDILSEGGMITNDKDNLFLGQKIVESSEHYSDLLCLKPLFNIFDEKSQKSYFIRIDDLKTLLLSKGLSMEDISITMNEGLYINREAILNLGANNIKSNRSQKK